MIAVPSHGDVKLGCTVSIARCMSHFAAMQYDGKKMVQICAIKSAMLPQARRRLVSQAYLMEATHILWVDSDMKFPADALARLLNHNLAVVGVNYPQKTIDAKPTAYADTEDFVGPVFSGERASGIQQVSIIGLGLVLTDLRVFDAVKMPIFQFEPQPPDYIADSGEDAYFCKLLHEAGIPVHIDHDLSKEVAHIGEFEYTNFLSKEAEIVKQAMYRDL